jgi:hypothetical protein
MRLVFQRKFRPIEIALIIISIVLFIQSCTREKIIIYKPFTAKVILSYPPDGDAVFSTFPELAWRETVGAISYQVQIARDDGFRTIVDDAIISDTTYLTDASGNNATYYWRVRPENDEYIWGDWSDASIRSFRISDSSDYFELVATVPTPGIAQDVFVQDEVAYVADGQCLLTLIDVADPANPQIIGNLDRDSDDFARAVWKAPGDDIAYVADTDGKIMAMDISMPLDPYSMRSVNLGFAQNLYELTGLVYQDTIYLFTVNSGYGRRKVFFHQIVYENTVPRTNRDLELPLFTDGSGVFFDSLDIVVEYRTIDTLSGLDSTYYEAQRGMFVFAAASEGGLGWFDISQTHTFDNTDTLLLQAPRELGWCDTPSLALSVFVKDGFAYVADDRSGLQIIDLPDTIPAFDHDSLYSANPVLIADINTSGRTKDVHIVGNYCFLADGSGGLKVVDISNPYAPVFLSAYTTPYAYGVWADGDYIYLADRDNGVMIFENKM